MYKVKVVKLNIKKNDEYILPMSYFLDLDEDKIAFLKGAFLACGSCNDPKKSGYHLEFFVVHEIDAKYILEIIRK